MFLDEATIKVQGGKGGDGLCSFHREKYVPFGGPDGGNGGNGGSVILQVNVQFNTLLDMGHKRTFRAEKGVPGGPKKCSGKCGADLMIQVPRGTIVRDERGQILADLTADQQCFTASPGGKGGKGNYAFKTPNNRAPRKATGGKEIPEHTLKLELKLMADVGLVGFPNAGKSSLVRKISKARPKVADYPFTTLEPILGIVQSHNGSFVVADIPGLIEGAAMGKGLGHTFLKHIERTQALLYVIDGSLEEAWEQFCTLRQELRTFHPALLDRNYQIALNKSDLGVEEAEEIFRSHGEKVTRISALQGEGLPALTRNLGEFVSPYQSKGWD